MWSKVIAYLSRGGASSGKTTGGGWATISVRRREASRVRLKYWKAAGRDQTTSKAARVPKANIANTEPCS